MEIQNRFQSLPGKAELNRRRVLAGSFSPPQHQHTRSADTRITIPGKVLVNTAALKEETLHPESTLINAERGRGFVEIASGNYAFTRETMVHTCGSEMSTAAAPCLLEVAEGTVQASRALSETAELPCKRSTFLKRYQCRRVMLDGSWEIQCGLRGTLKGLRGVLAPFQEMNVAESMLCLKQGSNAADSYSLHGDSSRFTRRREGVSVK
ncbi:hypothetical protein E2C01_036497 [Portunus trituberculatus]|uniref:Uncharacterized protein n=1 Tax=Portunus trituberculatus TaxID=210409 RepID=A0A5B7FC34_PORTR|nr:hypothetical protein [Portunus trituberculatus]